MGRTAGLENKSLKMDIIRSGKKEQERKFCNIEIFIRQLSQNPEFSTQCIIKAILSTSAIIRYFVEINAILASNTAVNVNREDIIKVRHLKFALQLELA